MATTAKNGTTIVMYIDDVLIGGSTTNSLSTSHSPREATSKDSGGWKEMCEGLREWSADGEGFFSDTATYGYNELYALIESRAAVTLRFSSETSGEEYHEGSAILTELSQDAPLEESTTFSFSFEGTGPLNRKALT